MNLKRILDEKNFCFKIKNLAHTLICQNIDELIFRGYKPEIIVIDRFNSCIINVSINFLGINVIFCRRNLILKSFVYFLANEFIKISYKCSEGCNWPKVAEISLEILYLFFAHHLLKNHRELYFTVKLNNQELSSK